MGKNIHSRFSGYLEHKRIQIWMYTQVTSKCRIQSDATVLSSRKITQRNSEPHGRSNLAAASETLNNIFKS